MRRTIAALTALLLAAGTSACASDDGTSADDRPRLAVSGAYVPEPPLADMAAGYLTVANTGKAADELVSATSDIATDVSLHTTTSVGAMKEVKGMAVPAGGRLVLETGGDHLMLMGLKRKPKSGETVTFVLRFATSAPITVRAQVEPAGNRRH
ncbi:MULTISPECIES: copper chaperone PCu(A)C [Thermomonosporaceae]|uniref:copper chaperone PCu(A)C n=1 Tax=Thermomonosporaceae TaxID=2012 RepID=UPI00255B1815|nr:MULTISPECIES: copper chaperone PCu(A)C [Thermomonosporaceae]MDL4772958.1 copper chaperone PCu(A)C [Actinomadura xylanilytica]